MALVRRKYNTCQVGLKRAVSRQNKPFKTDSKRYAIMALAASKALSTFKSDAIAEVIRAFTLQGDSEKPDDRSCAACSAFTPAAPFPSCCCQLMISTRSAIGFVAMDRLQ
ncbi:hypothetical protein K503DRAFT_60214 [Rhizopogon vinicolor AM-OR11-026]|uniref:Uncharacterized protein n=1 Tax=Rhizopogon vinicolor AM-OR11-026 TaxID=1314800 RepID=A0A1B7MGF1_9AGAM|nr:hypothetical protein K503DRAFT_128074 [Rhizopogon vinicolor AM-OR11-026]OAX31675.1 hypothetical protein K503DRAFT_60214 [Rhizopogon vinicolor AM-OR11-026]